MGLIRVTGSIMRTKQDHTSVHERLLGPDIARGVCRLMVDLDFLPVTELKLGNRRRADVAAISRTGEIIIVEVKSGPADFNSDHKWQDYTLFCDRFYFAVPPAFPTDILPGEYGLILADNHIGEVMREAPVRPLSAARRKATLIRFGRVAADRLRTL